MKALPKNWLLQIKNKCFLIKKQEVLLCFLFFTFISRAQIANYVSNGSFESLNTFSTSSLYNVVNYWQPIDTNAAQDYLASTDPAIGNAPYAVGFQYPRTGKNYIISTFYCPTCTSNQRGYPRNRLKQPLQAGKAYCVKYYVSPTNNATIGIDKYGAYFENSTLDTITNCNIPLTFLNPQIENTTGIITDTLNWTPITGTFVATGNEKYMVLGNFRSDASTNTLLINPTYLPTHTNDVCIDDASVIELTLPAYAGPDIYGIPTTTVYLGRPQDIGIDEACMWYKLPNTTTAIDTAAGITVTVATTTQTYMVKQDICGNIKYDTVVVFASGTGFSSFSEIENNIRIYPNPISDNFKIEFLNGLSSSVIKVQIINFLGQIVKEEKIKFEDRVVEIKTDLLNNGVYTVNLFYQESSINMKIVISK